MLQKTIIFVTLALWIAMVAGFIFYILGWWYSLIFIEI